MTQLSDLRDLDQLISQELEKNEINAEELVRLV
ncbi:flagellar protein FliT, partial [Vibrio vulnificus]